MDSKFVITLPTSGVMEDVIALVKNPWIDLESMLVLVVDYWRYPNPNALDEALRDYLLGGMRSKDINDVEYLDSETEKGFPFLKDRKEDLFNGLLNAYGLLKPIFDRFLHREYNYWTYGPVWVRLFAGDMVLCLVDIKRIAPTP